jgi:hypothetical protein
MTERLLSLAYLPRYVQALSLDITIFVSSTFGNNLLSHLKCRYCAR